MQTRTPVLVVAAAAATVGMPFPASADHPMYSITVIPVLDPTSSYDFARPTGMNDVGEIVGFVGVTTQLRGFRWQQSQAQPTALGSPPGLSYSIPADINNDGLILGNAGSDLSAYETNTFAWSYEGGVYNIFSQFVTGRSTAARGLNNLGEIVGTANDGTFTGTRALRFNAGSLQLIFNENATAAGINNLGHIIGSKVGGHYIYDPAQSQITYIPPPSAALPYINLVALNDQGMVVGNVTGPQIQTRYALVWTAATGTQTLPTLGIRNFASMVNNQGIVAGHSDNTGVGPIAWIWTAADGLSPLNDRLILEPGQNFRIWYPGAINELGQIAAVGTDLNSSNTIGLLLTPTNQQPPCYANCDQSTTAPILNVDDFTCFINEFAGAQSLPHAQQLAHYANCDNSAIAPVLNVDDFTCFINAFATGCP